MRELHELRETAREDGTVRLRTLLMVGYATVIVILLASGAVIATGARTRLKATLGRDAEALAGAVAEEIDLALRERVERLRSSVGVNEELHRAIRQADMELDRLGDASTIQAVIEERNTAWEDAPDDVTTPTMRAVMDSDGSRILQRVMEFHGRGRDHDVFAEIFVTGRHGVNVAQTGRTTDYLQRGEEWWDEAWDAGTWISNVVERDLSAKVDSLEIGVRVDDEDGRRLGVLKAVMTIDDLRDIIEAFGRRSGRPGAVVELVDHRGHLVHRLGDPDAFGTDLSGEAAVRAARAGESGWLVESTGNGDMLRAYVGDLTGTPGATPGWSLILGQPTAIAFEPLDQMTQRMVVVGLIGASLAILVGLAISRAFARLARRLEDTSEALRGSEAHVRSILTSAVDGIVTADTSGRIETFNPAAEEIFGYTADEVIGRNVRILMPEPHAAAHDGYLRRYRETGEAHVMGSRVQLQGLRKDGTQFPLDLSLGETKQHGTHRYVAVLRDATARRAAERALEEARDAAESASRSKSQFLANMSHELRTPLNAIIGYSEMVAEELEDTQSVALANDVAKIRQAGLGLLALIDQILDLSKLEAGRLEVYPERFDLATALEDVRTTVLPLMRRKGNALEVDAPGDLGEVVSDITKVRQILLNLLSNAAKFTESGTVRLSARREPGDDHDWIVLQVRDDGIGMSAEELETIWEAFAQADASTTRRYGGTGLGLTITRSFAELLGGRVEVASTPGAGTTFTVRLPARVPGAAEETAPPSRPVHADPARRPRVVVIDDDDATRDLVQRHLSAADFDVSEASNGAQGLELVRRLRPAAIVLDVLMPDMDGWNVLAKLREDPDVGSTPVVMLTMSEQRDLGFALGVDAYLAKPVSREVLTRTLARYRPGSSRYRVLVVEDDEPTRLLTTALVERAGHTVRAAENGAVALELLEEEGDDVVVVDLMMPVMDGFELIQRLRDDPRWRELPVLVVTAREITDADVARLDGAVGEILRKGHHTTQELLEEVGRLARRAAGAGRGDGDRDGVTDDA